MTDFVILGTDTDAGKTTFALLWVAAFGDKYAYWKPLESGDSDSQRVRTLIPAAQVASPMRRFLEPVAPLLAARSHGDEIPTAAEIAAIRPLLPDRNLVIETFGSPFSPLNETELQIDLIRRLNRPTVLVSSSAVGAIGRTLQCLRALAVVGIKPAAVVLVGTRDPFAEEQIARYANGITVASVSPPADWNATGIDDAAREQIKILEQIRAWIDAPTADDSSWIRRDRNAIWHPYTSLREPDDPLTVMGACDEFLTLADGRRVIDGISSWWTIQHGHRHPPLMQALAEAAMQIDHVHFAGVTHPWAVELAERMLATMPWPGGRVFYSDNGSTAVEVALKMAYQYWCHRGEPQRTLFVGFEGGYHGDTFGAMSVGRDPLFFGRFDPLLFRAEMVPVSADRLDDVLKKNAGRVAAVILEPLVQGAGGMRMHTPEELRAIFEVTRQHDVLFIADEVMTGGGRTGTLWAHQAAGIAPDLVCAAKTLAGGILPLAATLASPRIVVAWDTDDRTRTFFHGHSFTGHPLACAVALANWKSLPLGENPHAKRIETFWRGLEELRNHPRVEDVRIRGTIAAIEIDTNGGYLAEIGRAMRRSCLERGVLLRPLGSVLYAMPPFCTSDDSLMRIVAAMTAAIRVL